LRHQLAGKAGGILNNDGANTIALNAVEQISEAMARLNRVGTGNGGVGELSNQGNPARSA
jgi:hypothetical protein